MSVPSASTPDPVDSDQQIRSPNPGLRPFLDYESAIFFGRQSQIAEVIQRLRGSQFVAVLGGSGSGKSSLIRAGVIPALRGYQIRDAGDFWIPIVTVPGTNIAQSETAIDRLARKFSQCLKPLEAFAAQTRRNHIADLLRGQGGLARIVETYGAELDAPAGPDAESGNFLFLLDQFEELFHPSNRGVKDCERLIDRVLDHFNSPHRRVFVIITLRTEHLNDCAAYLHLPEVINKASYLVRRLDPSEIDEAIIKPAQRYLRMLSRAPRHQGRLPEKFSVEKHVLNRLRLDVEALHADPDHLPLLQHLLAHLWEMASARTRAAGMDMPDSLVWEDLERAVSAVAQGTPPPIDADINVLRASLENWSHALYVRLSEGDRAAVDRLLVRLAFRDPNTGMYTQQRVTAGEAADIVGGGRSITGVRKLLADFIAPMDYLHWDDADPSRVTMKVSHESFIRGWPHFRQLIDAEADRFEEYLALLRDVADWEKTRDSDHPNGVRASLLGPFRLRRVRELRLDVAIEDAESRRRLQQLLSLKRDGDRWLRISEKVPEFLKLSAIEVGRRARRRTALLFVVPAVVIISLMTGFLFSQKSLMGPATSRFKLLADQLAESQQLAEADAQTTLDQRIPLLAKLVKAADCIISDEERSKAEQKGLDRVMYRLLDWPNRVKRGIDRVRIQAVEPLVNKRLRELLSSTVWNARQVDHATRQVDYAMLDVPIADTDQCKQLGSGKLVYRKRGDNDSLTTRALFIPRRGDATGSVAALTVTLGEDDTVRACAPATPLIPARPNANTVYAVEASLRYLFVSGSQIDTGSDDPATRYLQMYEVLWGAKDALEFAAVRTVVALTEPEMVATVDRLATMSHSNAIILPSTRVAGGRAIKIGDYDVRQFADSAHRLNQVAAQASDWEAMASNAGDQGCRADPEPTTDAQTATMAGGIALESLPYRVSVQRTEDLCVEVMQAGESSTPQGVSDTQTYVNMYRPIRDENDRNDWAFTGTIGFGEGMVEPSAKWIVGTKDTRNSLDQNASMDGWIAVQRRSDREEPYWAGAPWSTKALRELAQGVLEDRNDTDMPVNAAAGSECGDAGGGN